MEGIWDFNKAAHRERARHICTYEDPDWIIGSPPCTDFSVLGRWNHRRMKAEHVRRRMKEARRHLEFCMILYQDQLDRGKHLLHEHPVGASSWKEERVEILVNDSRVDTAVGYMCQYGMVVEDNPGIMRVVKKPTRWMSSSRAMLERLKMRCPGYHEHASLLNGRAKQAAIYPEKLCVDILKGM